MHTTLAAQLAQLELGALTIHPTPGSCSTDLPADEAIEQTLAAVWSDLFQLFPDTALEDDAEEIAWGFVNLFHRAAAKRSAQIDRATDEIRCLLASNDGSEVHSSQLEEQVARAQSAEAAMIALESLREVAAALYLNETASRALRCITAASTNTWAVRARCVRRAWRSGRKVGERRSVIPIARLLAGTGGTCAVTSFATVAVDSASGCRRLRG
jgi:hypothetical protein